MVVLSYVYKIVFSEFGEWVILDFSKEVSYYIPYVYYSWKQKETRIFTMIKKRYVLKKLTTITKINQYNLNVHQCLKKPRYGTWLSIWIEGNCMCQKEVALTLQWICNKGVTRVTMLQIYLYPATAIGKKVATLSSHFLTTPKEFHSLNSLSKVLKTGYQSTLE